VLALLVVAAALACTPALAPLDTRSPEEPLAPAPSEEAQAAIGAVDSGPTAALDAPPPVEASTASDSSRDASPPAPVAPPAIILAKIPITLGARAEVELGHRYRVAGTSLSVTIASAGYPFDPSKGHSLYIRVVVHTLHGDVSFVAVQSGEWSTVDGYKFKVGVSRVRFGRGRPEVWVEVTRA